MKKRIAVPETFFQDENGEFVLDACAINGEIIRLTYRDPETGVCYTDISEQAEAAIRAMLIEVKPSTQVSNSDSGSQPDSSVTTHRLTVATATQLISEINDLATLELLEKSELTHPDFKEGRRGVLSAIAQRRQELQG